MINDFDRKHIEEIIRKPDAYTWFTAQLIRLIAKADTGNRELIREVYPQEVAAYEDWYHQRGFYAPKAGVQS